MGDYIKAINQMNADSIVLDLGKINDKMSKEEATALLSELPVSEDIIEEVIEKQLYGRFISSSVKDGIIYIIKNHPENLRDYKSIVLIDSKSDRTILVVKICQRLQLSQLGIYTDTRDGDIVRTDKDVLVKYDGNFVVVKNNKHIDGDDDFGLNNPERYTVSFDTSLDFNNIKDWPIGVKPRTPIKLHNTNLHEGITVDPQTPLIEIAGDCVIDCVLPISVSSETPTLNITGKGTLTLKAGYQQPCIGVLTNVGMSYGRWSPSPYQTCDKIIIRGVKVICEPAVEAFSLGTYGDSKNKVPEIICVDGGEFIGPETEGERLIVRQASAPEGSTKISDSMVYAIKKPGMTDEDLISNEAKQERENLPDKYKPLVSYKTPIRNIIRAVELLKMNNELDISPLLIKDDIPLMILTTCVILNANGKAKVKLSSLGREFFFEIQKGEWSKQFINESVFYPDETVSATHVEAAIIKWVQDNIIESDFRNEFMYEMIGTYSHQFNRDETHLNNALQFMEDYYDERYYSALNVEQIQKLFE